MNRIIRSSALALALLGGVALASAPTLAGSYKHSHGKSWQNNNNYKNNSQWKCNHQAYRSYNRYSNPGYAYSGPGPSYGYGPNYNYARPGFSLYIRLNKWTL